MMMPLREVHELGQWAKADPRHTEDYVCGLIAATEAAVRSAMKAGRLGGWLFGQEAFILAVRAIRDINAGGTVCTYGTDLEQRIPAAWEKLADMVEAYASDVPRPCFWMADGTQPPSNIKRGINDGWDRPVQDEVLRSLFNYCLTRAMAAFPADRSIVETYYKTGVFNIPLNTTQTLARIEAGQGETHRRLLTSEERILAAVADTKTAVERIDANTRRGADAAEGAREEAKKAAENSEITGRLVLNHMTPRPGDYEVTQIALSKILEGLGAGVTVKTIQRWEKYLATNGKEGTKPPDGYTLQTRQTLAGATAWARAYAAREKSKLNTRVSLDRLTGGRR